MMSYRPPNHQPSLLVDDSWTLVYARAVSYAAPRIVASITFSIGLTHDSQMCIEVPAKCLISQYHLVDRLVMKAHAVPFGNVSR